MDDAATAVPGIDGTHSESALISVLLLGDARDLGMAPIAGRVMSMADNETRVVADVESACELVRATGWYPDLIVVLQTWSDQFSATDVLKLLSLTPLARVVCAAGAWCDSDSRTRSSWPIAVRIRAVDALARIERELALLRQTTGEAGDRGPQRSGVLPLTASRAEVFHADMNHEATPSIDGSQIIIHSPDRAWLGMIESAFGIRSDSSRGRTKPPKAVLVDVDPWGERAQKSLRAAKTSCPGARMIACTGVAANDFGDELKSVGADGVWFKLSPLAALRRLISADVSCEPPA